MQLVEYLQTDELPDNSYDDPKLISEVDQYVYKMVYSISSIKCPSIKGLFK